MLVVGILAHAASGWSQPLIQLANINDADRGGAKHTSVAGTAHSALGNAVCSALGQAKVADLDQTRLAIVQQRVLQLDVAIDDPGLVAVIDANDQLLEEPPGTGLR